MTMKQVLEDAVVGSDTVGLGGGDMSPGVTSRVLTESLAITPGS
jgi:hypothetical protein